MVENVLFEGGATELLCGKGLRGVSGRWSMLGAEMRWAVRGSVLHRCVWIMP